MFLDMAFLGARGWKSILTHCDFWNVEILIQSVIVSNKKDVFENS